MSCSTNGNSDMYGLGIRLGFYLQWIGGITSEWLCPSETLALRLTNTIFIAATFLALPVLTSFNNPSAIDIYIALLLTFGAYYYFVPLYIWRLITGCSPFWDPSRWSRVPASRLYSILTFGLLVAVSIYQTWFWCTGIYLAPEPAPGPAPGCQNYGFFLAQVPLRSTGFMVVNILLNITLTLICIIHFCFALGIAHLSRGIRRSNQIADEEGISPESARPYQTLNILIRYAVAGILITAVELVIQWNNLTGVNEISTAGQTIPLAVGAAATLRILYVGCFQTEPDDDDESDNGRESIRPQSLDVMPGPIHARPPTRAR